LQISATYTLHCEKLIAPSPMAPKKRRQHCKSARQKHKKALAKNPGITPEESTSPPLIARSTELKGTAGTSIPLPNLTWSDIVSSREGTPTQGQCILDLIELGKGAMSQLSIIHRPVALPPPTGVRGSTRPSIPPDYLKTVSLICHVAPSTVHYHFNTDPTSNHTIRETHFP
jgi:hypothetical protein